jgi:hypothetical protein
VETLANTPEVIGVRVLITEAMVLQEGPAAHQLVGVVTAYQGEDG